MRGTAPNPSPSLPFTILIVDDNRDFVDLIKHLLNHHGFDAVCAYSGAECLEITRRQNIDLVLLDVMMPKMDGLSVCRELKSIAPDLPVFLLTAKDDLATRAAAMEFGASEFLTKPVNIEDFLTRVRTQCHISHWDKNLATTLGTAD